MTDTYTDLREKAEAATPGPWTRGKHPFRSGNLVAESTGQIITGWELASKPNAANAAYIAAANPQRILALLDENKVLRARPWKVIPAYSGMVPEDFYSPEDVIAIRDELEAKLEAAEQKIAAVEQAIEAVIEGVSMTVNTRAALVDIRTALTTATPKENKTMTITEEQFDVQFDADHKFHFTESEDATIMAWGHDNDERLLDEVFAYDTLCDPANAERGEPGDLSHVWALPLDTDEDWYIHWSDAFERFTEATPGAVAVTVWAR